LYNFKRSGKFGGSVYITGIRFRKHGATAVRGWRLAAGVGKLRPVVAFQGEALELTTLARALVFALSGKRHAELAEVWLDAADDAGDVWTIERGTKGTLFRKNSRLLSTEEAQGSLLASLLDLDASLSHAEVLVAPVELRQIISRGADVAATVWDLNERECKGEVAATIAAKDLALRCAEIAECDQFRDEKKLSRIAGPSARLLGGWEELQSQAVSLGGQPLGDIKLDPGLEIIQSEIDILNQIDQLLRRVNEGGESVPRLVGMLDSFNNRLLEIETKWPKETLSAIVSSDDPYKMIDLLARLVACTKLSDNVNRLKLTFEDQLRPINAKSIEIWADYISGAHSGGQEIESCLASMLLGIKQMAQEVDRYVSQAPAVARVGSRSSSGWFEKLKESSSRLVDERLKDGSPALQLQREWISRLAKDVDSLKVATEYALRAAQGLGDQVADATVRFQKELATIPSMASRLNSEKERLRKEWSDASREFGIAESTGIESLTGLIRDASEYLVIRDTRQDLAIRVEDRRAVQAALESAVRQWWEIIGSQKSTDLSNLSFLIAEAKGALRYRDGRRQRIQKGLEETAERLGGCVALRWVSSRQEEVRKEWSKLFGTVDLPATSIDDPRNRQIVDLAHRCAALLDAARIEEQERFAAASLWPSRLDSAVLVYRWMEDSIPASQRTSFVKSLSSFTGDGVVPVILLLTDSEMSKTLVKLGTGSASFVEFDSLAAIDGPRREGAIVKTESKSRKLTVESRTRGNPNSSEISQPAARPRDELMTKAEAALRVLNPKANR
jgi:hypothetical protein